MKRLDLDKRLLYSLYVNQEKSSTEIGNTLNCNPSTIRHYLHKYNIKLRNRGHSGKNNPFYGKRGKNTGNWKGGKTKTFDGYILIYVPDHPNKIQGKYVLEHRLVMEKKIGRYLERWEIVHHINGIRNDNRPENLELLPNGQENLIIDNLMKENQKLKQENKKLRGVIRDGGITIEN